MLPDYFEEAFTFLARHSGLEFIHQLPKPELSEPKPLYDSLLRSIVFQQLSGKAASTIWGRFVGLFGNKTPDAQTLLSTEDEVLRSAGLSNSKTQYVKAVAAFDLKHHLHHPKWLTLSDEELIRELTTIKGIGKWSVEMLLIFTLHRPDVFPLDDLGIQQAMSQWFGWESKGKALQAEMLQKSQEWQPYRSLATLYLWQWKDKDK